MQYRTESAIHVSEHLRIRTRSQENLALYCATFADETALLQPGVEAPSDIAVKSYTEEANPPNRIDIPKRHATYTRVAEEEVEVKRDIWYSNGYQQR